MARVITALRLPTDKQCCLAALVGCCQVHQSLNTRAHHVVCPPPPTRVIVTAAGPWRQPQVVQDLQQQHEVAQAGRLQDGPIYIGYIWAPVAKHVVEYAAWAQACG
jgi:hypothetical protein